MQECGICTDPYNKVRRAVECPSCQASACTRCVKTYLMSNTVEPKCMGCQSAWDMEFVRKNLSRSFLDSDYKKHQVSALLSQAEASLGEIQRFVAVRNRLDVVMEEVKTGEAELEELRAELGPLITVQGERVSTYRFFMHTEKKEGEQEWDTIQRWTALSKKEKKAYCDAARVVNKRLATKRVAYREKRSAIYVLRHQEKRRLEVCLETGRLPEAVVVDEAAGAAPADKAVFFMACPRQECRGRVSSAYKCGLCEHWACPDCHGDKGLERNGPHECRDEDKETVRMLKENTKNCPECHEGIFKEYGCDQMWCTRCQTCFSWITGKKLNGTIHNPHYYEYMRQNGGQAAAQAQGGCDGFPEYHSLERKWRYDSGISNKDQVLLSKTHRLVNHVRYVELDGLRNTIAEHETKNGRKWGVEYLRNNVTREEWGQKLYLAYRKKERAQRMLNIMEMFVMVSQDIYRNWYNNAMTGPEMTESVRKLLQYANENISTHNKQYGTKTALLDPSKEQRQHILNYYPARY